MGLVDPNAPTQIDPTHSRPQHYDAYGNPLEPVQYAQPVQYVQPVEPVAAVPRLQPREVMYPQPVQPVEVPQPVQPIPPSQVVEQVEPGEPLVPAARAWDVYRTTQVIYFALAVLETLIVIRVILRLLAANPSAPFSTLIYGLTYPFVALFSGVFPSAGLGSNVLELSSVLALLVYPLVAWLIVRVIHLAAQRDRTA